ncbi:hypothetical protein E2C01_065942 [Portunus trituberculatus]|uniref:Uncharacterized protein n=1 Tax=Portunus trituberculatus TaxID=210409 RepID=A0A5B7HR17_PORTR|nr:hypothetical protein [Portunus trituberculatus]
MGSEMEGKERSAKPETMRRHETTLSRLQPSTSEPALHSTFYSIQLSLTAPSHRHQPVLFSHIG